MRRLHSYWRRAGFIKVQFTAHKARLYRTGLLYSKGPLGTPGPVYLGLVFAISGGSSTGVFSISNIDS